MATYRSFCETAVGGWGGCGVGGGGGGGGGILSRYPGPLKFETTKKIVSVT